MFIKVYLSQDEKNQIERDAKTSGAASTSKYLKERAFAEHHHRAALVELIGHMVKLVEAESLPTRIADDLFAIAQDVLDGKPIAESRSKIAEVCRLEDQSE